MVRSTTPRTLIVGTRASKLALAQTEIVCRSLLAASPELDIRVERITTRGDEVQDRPLSEIGGNGLFVSVIEAALREGKIDIAVHSAKDLSTTLPPDLALVAFPRRADPRDVLISREGATLAGLPAGAVVGTSSPRRTCLLRDARPDLELRNIRGNVDTRLRKLRDGDYDAIVLAAAGLERLGLLENVTEWLDPEAFVPAVAQGALAVEARSQDAYVKELLTALDDPPTSIAVRAERAFLARLSGGCSLPVGAYATLAGDRLRIVGMVGSVEGAVIRGEQVGSATAPERAGVELAERLLARRSGARRGERGSRDMNKRTARSAPQAVKVEMPLRGKRIVVTRAEAQAGEIVARLQALGADPVECPAITIEPLRDPAPLDEAISRLTTYDWVIFTSVNGVTHFAKRLTALGKDASILCERKLAAIGPATRAELERLGCRPDFMPPEYVAEAIIAQIGIIEGQRVLLPRADIAREALAAGLRALGADVDEVTAYHTVRGKSATLLLGMLRERSVDVITFTSSSTVRFTVDGLVDAGADSGEAVTLLNAVEMVCIGPVTAETARRYGLHVTATSNEYTVDGLIASVIGLYARPHERGT